LDALHGLVYCIFSKILEDPRGIYENSNIKIPPKSPCTKFQSLGKFKIHILISKGNLSWLSAQSVQQQASPLSLLAQSPQPAFFHL
jgi:hypothetical protein